MKYLMSTGFPAMIFCFLPGSQHLVFNWKPCIKMLLLYIEEIFLELQKIMAD